MAMVVGFLFGTVVQNMEFCLGAVLDVAPVAQSGSSFVVRQVVSSIPPV